MSKEVKLKVKRPCVDWRKALLSIVDEECDYDLYLTYLLLIKSSRRNENFCAYQALRHYYSSDRLEYLRWCVYGETDVIFYES